MPPVGGQLVSIDLSSDAIALLNSKQGGQFFFGGLVLAADTFNVELFGDHGAIPATLDLNTSVATPEPSSFVLLGTGLAAILSTARKKRHA